MSGAKSVERVAGVRTFKPYPVYKDSGVEWLGEIPADWDVRRLKRLISEPITDGPHETPEFLPDGIPFLSVDGIQEGELVFDGCRYISETAHKQYRNKCAPRRDDLLLGKAASTGKIARVKVDFEFGVWSPLALIRPDLTEARSDFLEYALKSAATQAQIDVLCTANTQKNISMRDIPVLVVCVAPLPQQRAIAAFLDRETTRIDALVAKKERLIELLQEKRTALITRAVTKGLDPSVPMKDSGVEWLGEIPAHWSITLLKRSVAFIADCPHETPVYCDRGEHFVVRTSDVSEGRLDTNNARRVDEGEYQRRIRRLRLIPDDIVYSREGERFGFAAIVPSDVSGCLGQRMMQFRPGVRWSPRFLMWQLNSRSVRQQASLDITGATSPHVNVGTIRQFILAEPPFAEQEVVAEFIDEETVRFDALVARVREAIDRLEELRNALISAAATGKIDVRAFAGVPAGQGGAA